ncbi:hypothetical protein H6P81_018556 [Aristolochia fimbriata]|uniref:Amino acid transporter transmembrane domain-containing protein n=1 Tax=Aristolochia fimbriata TaxID=158543 RepID=A0AAV7E1P9_ARIFI|nr:hypothetical protein H6P81_018556 [Aristolochia fimbriata]
MLTGSRTLPTRIHHAVFLNHPFQLLILITPAASLFTDDSRDPRQYLQIEVQPQAPKETEAINAQDAYSKCFDGDGRLKRTGNIWTATSHIITAVIGSGVLSLAWTIAQLGWVAGPLTMVLFAFIILYTSNLLSECYRSGDMVTGKRNNTYTDAVKASLGGAQVKICGWIQYVNLFGVAIGYTIASSISMMAVKKSNCYHKNGSNASCQMSSNSYMIMFGITEVIFSQIPDFDLVWWLSIVAALLSFTYSSVGLSLGIAQVAENGSFKGSLTGISIGQVTSTQKVWRSLQALGDSSQTSFLQVLLHQLPILCLQDTINSPPEEYKTMKKANLISITVITTFYLLCGCMGLWRLSSRKSPHGIRIPQPLLAHRPGERRHVVHLVGAYQVYCQPLFAFVEKWSTQKWPRSGFIGREYDISFGGYRYKINLFRLVWRTAFVSLTTVISMLLPFFHDVVGILGAFGFWPLTVYFPVDIYISQKKIAKWSHRWVGLQLLSFGCLTGSIAACCGSIAGVLMDLKSYKPFS